MKYDIAVKELMTKDPVTVSWDTFIIEVKKIFKDKNIHHVPVLGREGDLAGIISNADLERKKPGGGLFSKPTNEEHTEAILSDIPAYELMSESLISLNETATINEAYQIFKENKVRAIPIVNNNEKLSGILTPLDLLNYFFNQ